MNVAPRGFSQSKLSTSGCRKEFLFYYFFALGMKSSELGLFGVFPKDIIRYLISFVPHNCWSLNKWFRSISYEFLPLQEKQIALRHAAERGYLEMLVHILEVIFLL